MFNYDPSVSCEDNPHPLQCKNWLQQDYIHYQRMPVYRNLPSRLINQHRVSCLDFYDTSDNKLVWWQQLRRENNFNPIKTKFNMHLDNNGFCSVHYLFYFHISNQSTATQKKYQVSWVPWAAFRKENKDPRVINICYIDNQTSSHDIKQMVIYSFQECLLYYGKLAEFVVNYPVSNN